MTAIAAKAFTNCQGLTKVVIPDSVTSIGGYAFSGCTSLTSIHLPNAITSIEEATFGGCTALTKINIPDSVKVIGSEAFNSCQALTNVEIPDAVTKIGCSAFEGCSNITNIKLPSSLTDIGLSLFCGCSSLTSIEIPESVTLIGESNFYNCISLTSIKIPDSVTTIGNTNFYGCSNLTNINIPNSITSIGRNVFDKCYNLTEVVIPADAETICPFPVPKDHLVSINFANQEKGEKLLRKMDEICDLFDPDTCLPYYNFTVGPDREPLEAAQKAQKEFEKKHKKTAKKELVKKLQGIQTEAQLNELFAQKQIPVEISKEAIVVKLYDTVTLMVRRDGQYWDLDLKKDGPVIFDVVSQVVDVLRKHEALLKDPRMEYTPEYSKLRLKRQTGYVFMLWAVYQMVESPLPVPESAAEGTYEACEMAFAKFINDYYVLDSRLHKEFPLFYSRLKFLNTKVKK